MLAIVFISAGVMHFLNPALFVRIIPTWISHGLALVYISGVFEILGGLAVLIPRTRRLAGLGLIALLIAVFPANIHMALHSEDFANIPTLALWLRLPLQFVIIAWVWSSAIKAESSSQEISD
jgi:uncharacterized membrane protein